MLKVKVSVKCGVFYSDFGFRHRTEMKLIQKKTFLVIKSKNLKIGLDGSPHFAISGLIFFSIKHGTEQMITSSENDILDKFLQQLLVFS